MSNDFLDITGEDDIEVSIREDGKVIWISTTNYGTVLRICQIRGKIYIQDQRVNKKKKRINFA